MTLTDAEQLLLTEVPVDRRPRHIAMIMDGNGRWAQRKNLPRIRGHQQGAITVREITETCSRIGIEQITLYCLSSENWKRPADELDFLMHLLSSHMIEQRQKMLDDNIVLKIIGQRDRIPESVQQEMDESVAATAKNTGTCVCLAINYGGRAEIVDAVRKISADVAAGRLAVDEIDEQTVSEHLYTAGMSDPDLLIRTAGEMRISNYLLWQISYAEMWVTEKTWPEFGVEDLHDAIRNYAGRTRRFGGLVQREDAATIVDEREPCRQEPQC